MPRRERGKEDTMARFRLVLLGAGFFARKWLEELKVRGDCEVVGIASRRGGPVEVADLLGFLG